MSILDWKKAQNWKKDSSLAKAQRRKENPDAIPRAML